MSKTEREDLVTDIIANVGNIADILAKGKDVELRTSRDGITVIEISKKVIR